MFLMSSLVKKSGQCQLRDKKHQYFSIVSLPTESVIVDDAVYLPKFNRIVVIYGVAFCFFDLTSDSREPHNITSLNIDHWLDLGSLVPIKPTGHT
jgi:hypothetical protein